MMKTKGYISGVCHLKAIFCIIFNIWYVDEIYIVTIIIGATIYSKMMRCDLDFSENIWPLSLLMLPNIKLNLSQTIELILTKLESNA